MPDPRQVEPSPQLPTGSGKLGTFGGVFTPSVLTILGVIMYLRTGWVVGQVGLIPTLLIVTLSTGITLLTALSVAEIATDRVVRVGGAYYMISRALGLETGGAVGIPLYLAQALSVGLYTIGFAESVAGTFPGIDETATALVTTVAVALLAMKSAQIAIRAQYLIMAAIALSLVSFVAGGPVDEGARVGLWTGAVGSVGFWPAFAVFFPAVTGIMAGVSMSGDLENPAKAIPNGTFAAIAVGYVTYMTIPVLLAMWADPATLDSDRLVMTRMAFWGPAILMGVWGATLSSALGSILGAPRVLQALARDGVLPRRLRFLGKGTADTDEPRIGTLFTLGLVLAVVAVADLNTIAPVLTMFFLTTYMVLNLAAGIETFLESPSFRPAFRVHWSLSLLGAVGCLAVMFLINQVATFAAAAVVLALFLWLQRRQLEATWGDDRNGLWMAMLRAGLLRVPERPDPRNWRPHLLTLSGAPTKRWPLVQLGADLTHNRGLLTVASVLPRGVRDADQRRDLERTIRDFVARRGVQCLVRTTAADDTFAGATELVHHYGLGPVVPNTVLVGASERAEYRADYCAMIRSFHDLRRNVLVLRDIHDRGMGARRRIDLWWGGLHHNGALMMILAYLLRTTVRWGDAEVRVKLVVPDDEAVEGAGDNLERFVARLRTGALPEVIPAHGRRFEQILHESSQEADLVMLGMATPDDDFTSYYESLQERTHGMPPTLFVLAARKIAFSSVLLDSPVD